MDTNESPARSPSRVRQSSNLVVVELGAHRLSGTIAGVAEQHREKRSVAAAVVEQPAAPEAARQREARVEPAAVTPGNQPILAEDLLGGVVALSEGSVQGFMRSSGRSELLLPRFPASRAR